MLIEDTLLSSGSTSPHAISALLSQKLDQAHEIVQNYLHTRSSNYLTQTKIFGMISHNNAPKVLVWLLSKFIQICSIIYLYYLVQPMDHHEQKDNTKELATEQLSLSVVGFYLLLGAALGWYVIKRYLKPHLGGIQNRKENEFNTQQQKIILSRIFLHSIWVTGALYLWLMALQLLAPTRVVILEYLEYVMAIIVGGLLKWRNSKSIQV